MVANAQPTYFLKAYFFKYKIVQLSAQILVWEVSFLENWWQRERRQAREKAKRAEEAKKRNLEWRRMHAKGNEDTAWMEEYHSRVPVMLADFIEQEEKSPKVRKRQRKERSKIWGGYADGIETAQKKKINI